MLVKMLSVRCGTKKCVMDHCRVWKIQVHYSKALLFIGDQISDRIAEYCNDVMWREPRTTSATFLGSIYAKLPTNMCPRGGLRHMVSYSRSFHEGIEFAENLKEGFSPKNPLFKGTLFVLSLRVTGNVLRRLHSFHPLWTSHRCALPRWLLLRDVPFSSYPCRKSPYQQWWYLDGETAAPPGERRDTNQ